MDRNKQTELLNDNRISEKLADLVGEDGYLLGYSVYNVNGDYLATVTDAELEACGYLR